MGCDISDACNVCKEKKVLFCDLVPETGEHRGDLCVECLEMLGLFDFNSELLKRTANYAEFWQIIEHNS